MADDCICTNLIAIHSVLSDIVTALGNINNRLNQQNSRLYDINDSINTGTAISYIGQELHAISGRLRITDENTDRNIIWYVKKIADNLTFNDKNIAEIWSYKEMCVSNETIVESPLSTYVSKGSLEFNDV